MSLPDDLGTLEESFQGNSEKTIVYIQDAHDSLEAQENIAKIIHELVDRYGVQTVYEEGYEGEVPTEDYFGFIKEPEVKEKVSHFLMDQLRIGGAEYAHINRKDNFKLIGADSIQLHLENIQWYREAVKRQEEIERDLSALETEIIKLGNQYFPKEFKAWLKFKKRHAENQLSLFDYLSRSKDYYFKTASEEPFLKKYPLISMIQILPMTQDPQVMEQIKAIDAKALFLEIEAMEEDLSAQFLESERDRQIFEYHRGLMLLKRLVYLEVTQAEYDAVRETLKRLKTEKAADFIVRETKKSIVLSKQWEETIRNAIKFYEVALERDHAIEARLDEFLKDPEQDMALLVFGGFHQNSIKKILKEKQLSYHVVTPKIETIDSRHRDTYKHLMSEGLHPQEASLVVARAVPAMRLFEMPYGMDVSLAQLRNQIEVLRRTVLRSKRKDRKLLYRELQRVMRNVSVTDASSDAFRAEVRSEDYSERIFDREFYNQSIEVLKELLLEKAQGSPYRIEILEGFPEGVFIDFYPADQELEEKFRRTENEAETRKIEVNQGAIGRIIVSIIAVQDKPAFFIEENMPSLALRRLRHELSDHPSYEAIQGWPEWFIPAAIEATQRLGWSTLYAKPKPLATIQNPEMGHGLGLRYYNQPYRKTFTKPKVKFRNAFLSWDKVKASYKQEEEAYGHKRHYLGGKFRLWAFDVTQWRSELRRPEESENPLRAQMTDEVRRVMEILTQLRTAEGAGEETRLLENLQRLRNRIHGLVERYALDIFKKAARAVMLGIIDEFIQWATRHEIEQHISDLPERFGRILSNIVSLKLKDPSVLGEKPEEEARRPTPRESHGIFLGSISGASEFPEAYREKLKRSESIVERILVIAEYSGVPESKLGPLAGKNRQLVRGWLKKGTKIPDPDTVRAIGKALEVDLYFLFTGKTKQEAFWNKAPAERARLMMNIQGIGLKELAAQLRISEKHMSHLLNLEKLSRDLIFAIAEILGESPVLIETGRVAPKGIFKNIERQRAGFLRGSNIKDKRKMQAEALEKILLAIWKDGGRSVKSWKKQIQPDPDYDYPGLAMRLLNMKPATVERMVYYGFFLKWLGKKLKDGHFLNESDLEDDGTLSALAFCIERAYQELKEFVDEFPALDPRFPGYQNRKGHHRMMFVWDLVARGMNVTRILALMNHSAVTLSHFKQKVLSAGDPEWMVITKTREIKRLMKENPILSKITNPRMAQAIIRNIVWRNQNPEPILREEIKRRSRSEARHMSKWVKRIQSAGKFLKRPVQVMGWAVVAVCAMVSLVYLPLGNIFISFLPVIAEAWGIMALAVFASRYKEQYLKQLFFMASGVSFLFFGLHVVLPSLVSFLPVIEFTNMEDIAQSIGLRFISVFSGVLLARAISNKMAPRLAGKQKSVFSSFKWAVAIGLLGGSFLYFVFLPFMAVAIPSAQLPFLNPAMSTAVMRTALDMSFASLLTTTALNIMLGAVFGEDQNVMDDLKQVHKKSFLKTKTLKTFLKFYPINAIFWTSALIPLWLFLADPVTGQPTNLFKWIHAFFVMISMGILRTVISWAFYGEESKSDSKETVSERVVKGSLSEETSGRSEARSTRSARSGQVLNSTDEVLSKALSVAEGPRRRSEVRSPGSSRVEKEIVWEPVAFERQVKQWQEKTGGIHRLILLASGETVAILLGPREGAYGNPERWLRDYVQKFKQVRFTSGDRFPYELTLEQNEDLENILTVSFATPEAEWRGERRSEVRYTEQQEEQSERELFFELLDLLNKYHWLAENDWSSLDGENWGPYHDKAAFEFNGNFPNKEAVLGWDDETFSEKKEIARNIISHRIALGFLLYRMESWPRDQAKMFRLLAQLGIQLDTERPEYLTHHSHLRPEDLLDGQRRLKQALPLVEALSRDDYFVNILYSETFQLRSGFLKQAYRTRYFAKDFSRHYGYFHYAERLAHELLHNILDHGDGGVFGIKGIKTEEGNKRFVEMVAMDLGPGMKDPEALRQENIVKHVEDHGKMFRILNAIEGPVVIESLGKRWEKLGVGEPFRYVGPSEVTQGTKITVLLDEQVYRHRAEVRMRIMEKEERIFKPEFIKKERAISKTMKTVVFDLDNTLAYYDRVTKKYILRKGIEGELKKLKRPGIRLILWTSNNTAAAEAFVDQHPTMASYFDLAITSDNSRFPTSEELKVAYPEIETKAMSGYYYDRDRTKDIALLGYDLIVDDNPMVGFEFSIHPYDYEKPGQHQDIARFDKETSPDEDHKENVKGFANEILKKLGMTRSAFGPAGRQQARGELRYEPEKQEDFDIAQELARLSDAQLRNYLHLLEGIARVREAGKKPYVSTIVRIGGAGLKSDDIYKLGPKIRKHAGVEPVIGGSREDSDQQYKRIENAAQELKKAKLPATVVAISEKTGLTPTQIYKFKSKKLEAAGVDLRDQVEAMREASLEKGALRLQGYVRALRSAMKTILERNPHARLKAPKTTPA